ncbi:MAG: pyridine nucleotide-disulfide oxidoreductase, partial [Bacteroidales bacterium]|nr:pyridine nucleotide-disulfide oxidoreductase [Bacteroidales bacterium]
MRCICFAFLLLLYQSCTRTTTTLFIEAESFQDKGGWVIDQQFTDIMGSPYLMAHGLGKAVKNASTKIEAGEGGLYRLWVRTKNWTAPFTAVQTPGIFRVQINSKEV